MSRRTALTAFGAGLTAFVAWPAAVRARAAAIPKFSFVVVSDTHLGRDDTDAAAKLWMQTAREIDAAPGDFVLHLGDIVDNSREAQYAVYKDVRKSIRKPVHEIPGNHDTQVHFEKHIRRNVDMAFDHQGVRFLMINNSRVGDSDGFVSREQIKWLGEQCAEAATKGQFIVMAMHVPAHDNTDHAILGSHVKPANGQTELYALLERYKDRVLALLHGHFHCGLRGWDTHTPLHEIVFPSALFNRNLLLTQRRAAGFNLPEFRPGFTLASMDKDGLTLRYKPVGVEDSQKKVLALGQFKT